MNFVGILRVKNEARWIEKSLDSLRPLCSQVFIFDDHSDDNTAELCTKAGAEVIASPFVTFDERRDKNHLLAHAIAAHGRRIDWILNIDGDEFLEPDGASIIRETIMHSHGAGACAPCFSLRVVYLWDRPDQIRVDGCYGRFNRPSLFAPSRSRCRYKQTMFPGNLHCSNAPDDVLAQRAVCEAKLMHFGYMERATRIKKWLWYNDIDPENLLEDHYRHVVQGDVPEVPASEKLLHAGPLQVEAWP